VHIERLGDKIVKQVVPILTSHMYTSICTSIIYKLFLRALPLLMKNVQMMPIPVRKATDLALAR
jgi:hypothetical protein